MTSKVTVRIMKPEYDAIVTSKRITVERATTPTQITEVVFDKNGHKIAEGIFNLVDRGASRFYKEV